MSWSRDNRRLLLRQIWQALSAGARELDHPFRTPTLATVSNAQPRLRTVILRDVLPARRLLVCHTDLRSPKVSHIRGQPRVQWLFHHPVERVQILVTARARLRHGDRHSLDAWNRTPLPSRMQYLTRHPPGTRLAHPGLAWPPALRGREPDRDLTAPGLAHFAMLECCAGTLEFLKLNRDQHRRIRFEWTGGRWSGTWLTP